jgi:hypothetical protein
LDIPDYDATPVITSKLLWVIFCYCSYTWAAQVRGVFHLDIFYIAEEDDGTEVTGSRNTTTVDIETHFDALLNMSLTFACFIDKAFF